MSRTALARIDDGHLVAALHVLDQREAAAMVSRAALRRASERDHCSRSPDSSTSSDVDAQPGLVEVRLEGPDALPGDHGLGLRRGSHAVGLGDLDEHLGGLVRVGLALGPEALDLGLQAGHTCAGRERRRAGRWAERDLFERRRGLLSSRESLDGREGFRVSTINNLYSTVCPGRPAPSSSPQGRASGSRGGVTRCATGARAPFRSFR